MTQTKKESAQLAPAAAVVMTKTKVQGCIIERKACGEDAKRALLFGKRCNLTDYVALLL